MNVIETSIDRQTFEETPARAEPMFPIRTCLSSVSSYPWHWHSEVELFVVENGALRYLVPGTAQDFAQGDIGFVNAKVLHMTQCLTPGQCVQMQHVFLPRYIAGDMGSVIDWRYVQPLVKNRSAGLLRIPAEHPCAAELRRRIRAVYDGCLEQKRGYEMAIRSELSAVWLALLDFAPQSAPSRHGGDDARTRAILSYIKANFAERISLEDLADVAGVCPREVSRCFRRQLGVSPLAYLLTYRVHRAEEMLRGSALPVTEISMNCGFNSVSYFGKLFRRQTGMSPTAYRESVSAAPQEAPGAPLRKAADSQPSSEASAPLP